MYRLENSFESVNEKFNVQQTTLFFRCANDQYENFLDTNEHVISIFESLERDFILPLENNKLVNIL